MRLTISRKRLLAIDYTLPEKNKLVQFMGALQNDSGISFPLDELLVSYFRKCFVDVEITSEILELEKQWKSKQKKAIEIKQGVAHLIGREHLKSYQQESLLFADAFKRVLIADEQGLGKSCTALTLCAAKNLQKVLIVCPGYLKLNWLREVKLWDEGAVEDVVMVDGERPQRELLLKKHALYTIVNYEMLRPDKKKGGYPQLLDQKWDAIIYDEAHRLKNSDSQYVKGARKIKSEYVLMLSGTPISGAPDQLWQLLNILYPERFTSKWAFIDYFCETIDTFFSHEVIGINKTKLKELQWMLQPIMIRHSKEGLPEKIHKVIKIKLEGKHKTAYKNARKFFIEQVEGENRIIESKLERIIRCQQIIANPAILGGENISTVEKTVLELLKDIGENRVIVGTVFVDAAKLLVDAIRSVGIDASIITGETRNRDKIVENFKKQEHHVLVGNISAMSEGLSIDGCDFMIFADTTWSPATNEQFENRIHRMTTTRLKNYYHIIVGDTISEYKHEALTRKQGVISNLLDDQKLVDELLNSIK